MLHPSGDVHVSHKTTGPFQFWNIEELAYHSSLALLECVEFKIEDYPNYKNKRGDGNRPDEPFPLGECSTFKFILSSRAMKSLHHRDPLQPQHISSQGGNASMVMNHAPIIREYFDHSCSTFGHTDDRLFYSAPLILRIGVERCEAKIDVNSLNDYINHLKELEYFIKGSIARLQKRSLEIDLMYGL